MGIFLGDTAPSKIFVGGSEVGSVWVGDTKVRPTHPPYDTYTIVWNETEDPSAAFVRYEDDAAGLTPGSSAFDTFFGYSGVKLASNGTESATVAQSSPGVLDITQLGTITDGDNVMIKFPPRGIKMSKSGTQVTLSITNGLGREAEGYQYYAFQNTGDIEANILSSVETHPLYIGAYISYNYVSTLKSWSGSNPMRGGNYRNHLTYSKNNGTRWTIVGWYQRQLISAYYMMKYANLNSQATIGTGLGSRTITGGTNSQTSATYGDQLGGAMKIFGLEDRWGNCYQWFGGVFTSGDDIWVALHDFTSNMSTSESQYKKAGTGVYNTSGFLTGIVGNSKAMFLTGASSPGGSDSKYYTDSISFSGSKFALTEIYGNYKGIFCTSFNYSNSYSSGSSRLMYI